MKPFRRTQVITFMAACAISTAWGQETPLVDQDALRAQIEAARKGAADARQAARDSLRIDINDQTRELTRDTVRAIEDRVWSNIDETALARINLGDMKILLAQDMTPKAQIAPMAPMPPMPPMPKGWN